MINLSIKMKNTCLHSIYNTDYSAMGLLDCTGVKEIDGNCHLGWIGIFQETKIQ